MLKTLKGSSAFRIQEFAYMPGEQSRHTTSQLQFKITKVPVRITDGCNIHPAPEAVMVTRDWLGKKLCMDNQEHTD